MSTKTALMAQVVLIGLQGTHLIYNGTQDHFDNTALSMGYLIEPDVIQMDHRDYLPLPKPTKQKLLIKEPKRQSFRQSMRSVNRNR